MLRWEFEQLTGIYPTRDLYKEIENEYYDFNGDKNEFCEAYKTNRDGIAERVQTAAMLKAHRQLDDIDAKDRRIAELEAQLEREQEWKPYEDNNNYQQTDYDHLKESGRVLTDDEAKDILYDWFGFAKEKVTIRHSVPRYEVNRHRTLRKVGEIERLPLYEATDWHYIRFDCGMMSYELVNDDLRPFVH